MVGELQHEVEFEQAEPVELFALTKRNRQCIVNMDAVISLKPQENSKLFLTMNPPLKFEVDVSREKASVFKRWMDL